MAIQMRRGLKADLDPTKLLPGEWAVSIDSASGNQMVYMCFAPGVVKQMGTYEDFRNMVREIAEDIQSDMIDATSKANNAAAKANEAANAILDEKYILTTRETFSNDASVSPTSKGNVIIEKLGGDTFQNGEPTPTAPQRIEAVGDHGWFDGELVQGNYHGTTGAQVANTYYVCSKNMIPCKERDSVFIKYPETCYRIFIFMYDKDGNYIEHNVKVNSDSVTFPIVNGASYFHFSISLYENKETTPQTAKHITVLINGTYATIVDKFGKNLAKVQDVLVETDVHAILTNAGNVMNNRKYKPNTQYTTSLLYKSSASANFLLGINVTYTDGTTEYLWYERGVRVARTTKPNKTVKSIHLTYNNKFNLTLEQVQTEEGAEATEYQPYTHQRIYIPLSAPLYKDDYIRLNDSKHEVVRGSKELVLDGAEDWGSSSSVAGRYFLILSDSKPVGKCICSVARFVDYTDAEMSTGINKCSLNSTGYFLIKTDFQTVAEWKAYLAEQYAAGTPVKIVYQLAEPIIEPIRHKSLYEITATEEVTNINMVISDNLVTENIFRFPRSEDGALVTTNFADNKKLEIKAAELETELATMMLDLV